MIYLTIVVSWLCILQAAWPKVLLENPKPDTLCQPWASYRDAFKDMDSIVWVEAAATGHGKPVRLDFSTKIKLPSHGRLQWTNYEIENHGLPNLFPLVKDDLFRLAKTTAHQISHEGALRVGAVHAFLELGPPKPIAPFITCPAKMLCIVSANWTGAAGWDASSYQTHEFDPDYKRIKLPLLERLDLVPGVHLRVVALGPSVITIKHRSLNPLLIAIYEPEVKKKSACPFNSPSQLVLDLGPLLNKHSGMPWGIAEFFVDNLASSKSKHPPI